MANSAQSPLCECVILLDVYTSDKASATSGRLKTMVEQLGAKVVRRLTRNVTHLVFLNGSLKTMEAAFTSNVFLCSPLWIEACVKDNCRAEEKEFPIVNNEHTAPQTAARKSMVPKDVATLPQASDIRFNSSQQTAATPAKASPPAGPSETRKDEPNMEARRPSPKAGKVRLSPEAKSMGVVPRSLANEEVPTGPLLNATTTSAAPAPMAIDTPVGTVASKLKKHSKAAKKDVVNCPAVAVLETVSKSTTLTDSTTVGGKSPNKRKRDEDGEVDENSPVQEEPARKKARVATTSSSRNQGFLAFSSVSAGLQDFAAASIKALGRFHLAPPTSVAFSHLVVEEPRRTLKVIQALATGAWIVTTRWLVDSFEAGMWLPERAYVCTEFPNGMPKTVLVKPTPLQGMKMFIPTPSNVPQRDLSRLAMAYGAEIVEDATTSDLIISNVIGERKVSRNTVTEQWLLDSATQGERLPLNKYKL